MLRFKSLAALYIERPLRPAHFSGVDFSQNPIDRSSRKMSDLVATAYELAIDNWHGREGQFANIWQIKLRYCRNIYKRK
ncbi:MAG: hypothetical protein AAF268_11295 [Cyanobacteria bacterium P01_A01_bin.3]